MTLATAFQPNCVITAQGHVCSGPTPDSVSFSMFITGRTEKASTVVHWIQLCIPSNTTIQGPNRIIGPLSIDNLIILVAAVIGLLGSYTIYRLRIRTRRRRLRKALRGEIKSMAPGVYEKARIMAAEDRDKGFYVPPNPVTSTVFKNNSGEIGLLTDDEVEMIAAMYSKAEVVRQLIEHLDEQDDPRRATVLQLRTDLIELNNLINDALAEIETALEVERTSGTVYEKLDDPGFDYRDELEELDEGAS